jgi:hypothetical protein
VLTSPLITKSIIFDLTSAILLRLLLLLLYTSSGTLRTFLYALPSCIAEFKFNCVFNAVGIFFILSETLISLCVHFARNKVHANFSLNSIFLICAFSILVSFIMSFFFNLDKFLPNYSSVQTFSITSIFELILLGFGGYIGWKISII